MQQSCNATCDIRLELPVLNHLNRSYRSLTHSLSRARAHALCLLFLRALELVHDLRLQLQFLHDLNRAFESLDSLLYLYPRII